jgi:hypothetical protein
MPSKEEWKMSISDSMANVIFESMEKHEDGGAEIELARDIASRVLSSMGAEILAGPRRGGKLLFSLLIPRKSL